jgi:phage-related minor tail protein
MADSTFNSVDNSVASAADLAAAMDRVQASSNSLTLSANAFAYAMTRAFTQATAGGKQLDDVFKSLALRISSLAVTQAFKPIASGITSVLTSGLNQVVAGLFGIKAGQGAIKPFAAGGLVGTPTYFPLTNGGVGLAGEAGPEAIVPLARGPDGRLGVAMSGAAAPANVTVQIATPDAQSFRRSEAYITGQIARAVARGQRSL